MFALYSPHTSMPQNTRCFKWGLGPLLSHGWAPARTRHTWVNVCGCCWSTWDPMPTVLPKLALNKCTLTDGEVSVDLCRQCTLRINYPMSVHVIFWSDLQVHLNRGGLWLLDTLSLPVKSSTVVLREIDFFQEYYSHSSNVMTRMNFQCILLHPCTLLLNIN